MLEYYSRHTSDRDLVGGATRHPSCELTESRRRPGDAWSDTYYDRQELGPPAALAVPASTRVRGQSHVLGH